MADKSMIEWTDATWNPVTGCTMVSAGCTNCYAMSLAATRLADHPSRRGLTRESGGRPVWTGKVRFNEEWLFQPIRWKKPRRVFVCAHGDLFHESVPTEWIDRVFAVMALAPQHQFQVLTKRALRMRAYLYDPGVAARVYGEVCDPAVANRFGVVLCAPGVDERDVPPGRRVHLGQWPLANAWLGVSIEDQATANERVLPLLETPAAIRFVSAEPLLGPVDLTCVAFQDGNIDALRGDLWGGSGTGAFARGLDWVIVGGESGPDARPMHPDWARGLRDQCAAAGTAFFFKQWGEWWPVCEMDNETTAGLYDPPPPDYPEAPVRCRHDSVCLHADGERFETGRAGGYHTAPRGMFDGPRPMTMFRVGKRRAGRRLDGVTHDDMPERQP